MPPFPPPLPAPPPRTPVAVALMPFSVPADPNGTFDLNHRTVSNYVLALDINTVSLSFS